MDPRVNAQIENFVTNYLGYNRSYYHDDSKIGLVRHLAGMELTTLYKLMDENGRETTFEGK